MDTSVKACASEVTKFIENDNGEPANLKLPENGDKAKENGALLIKAEDNESAGEQETGGKDAEGEESVLETEKMVVHTVTPTKDEGAGTEASEKERLKRLRKAAHIRMKRTYYDKALAISVLVQRTLQIWNLKKLFIEKLGPGTVRIKPILRGEKFIHIFFPSEDILNRGKEVLEERLPTSLKVEIVSGLGLKFTPSKKPLENKESPAAEKKESPAATSSPNQSDNANAAVKRKVEEAANNEPPAKKGKNTENQVLYFNEESYEEQAKLKFRAAKKIIEEFGKNLRKNVPELHYSLRNRLKKNNGLVCRISQLVECSPAQRLLARCKFAIGIDEDTGEVAVGFSTAEGKVKKNCKARQYLAPVIPQEADIFEKLVKSSEREPGQGSTGFWCELIVRSNTQGKVMLNVVVQAPKEKAQEELDYLKGIITEFYESGAGKNSKVISIYSTVMYTDCQESPNVNCKVALSWGLQYLEEKFLGMRLLLDSKTSFPFNVHAAARICSTVNDIVKPAKGILVIEIGCSSGYIGMHLSKSKCEVQCIGRRPPAAEAVLKDRNCKCRYNPGETSHILKIMKINSMRAIAVITTATQDLAPDVSAQLRRRKEIKRIVIITEADEFKTSEALTLLMDPGKSEELGIPFTPREITPVDAVPNTKHFTLVVLLERVSVDLSQIPKPTGAYAAAKMGPPFQSNKNVSSNRMGSYQNFANFQDESALLEEREAEAYRQQLLEEQEREAEEYRQRLIEEKEVEEYRQRLLEEKQREAAEYQRRLQEERAAEDYNQMQLEERLRIVEEQEYNHRLLMEARESEVRELSSKPTIQDVLSHSFTEAALSRLDNEAAGKLKHLIAEAIRGAGILIPKEQAVMHSGQDRMMSGTQYSHFSPDHQNPVGGSGVANESGIRNGRFLPFKDNFSHNIRTNERKPMGDSRGFDNATHAARMMSSRADKDAHPSSLDNRAMSFNSRISKDRNLLFKDNFSHSKITNERAPVDSRTGFDNNTLTARMTSDRIDRHVHPRSLDNRDALLDNRVSKDRNLPFKDNFSHSERTNEIEPMGGTRGFDDTSYTARMTSGRIDRNVHPRSLDNLEMSFSNRISKDRNLPFKDNFSHSKRTNEIEPMDDTRGFNNASYNARMTSGGTDRDVHPRRLDYTDTSFSNRISKDTNLPFKDNFSHSKRTNEIEPMGGTRSFDDASYTARMTSRGTDRYAHPTSFDNREMSFSNRISKETEAVNKSKPVSLLSLKFHPSIEANMSQEVTAKERWRNEDDSMYGRNWTDDLNRGMGRPEPWRTDTKQAGSSDNDPYFQGVHDMKQDNWRSYASYDTLTGSTAYGSESRMHVDSDTNRATETGYGSFSGAYNSKPPVYGHIYGRVKQSEVHYYRKPY